MTEYIEHYATVLASAVELEHGRITLHGLCDMIALPNDVPADGPVGVQLVLMSSWRRWSEPGVYFRQRVMMEKMDGVGGWQHRIQVSGPDDVDLVARHLYSLLNAFAALPLRGRGQYRFVVQREASPIGCDQWTDAPPTVGLWVPPMGTWPIPADQPRDRLKERVRAILAAATTETMQTTDVLQHVRADDYPELIGSLGTEIFHALNDLRRSGEVESVGPGNWRPIKR